MTETIREKNTFIGEQVLAYRCILGISWKDHKTNEFSSRGMPTRQSVRGREKKENVRCSTQKPGQNAAAGNSIERQKTQAAGQDVLGRKPEGVDQPAQP